MDINFVVEQIEKELQGQIAGFDEARTKIFHEMLTYHMGWTGEGAGPEATGKRIRPLLVLLCTAGSGGDLISALPAAAAVELVHNFSLVHDDIQDNSPKRRGRDTVWVKWGVPMAINAGDALFVLANKAITDLKTKFPADIVVKAGEILTNTCIDLTRGQYLDMSYENTLDLTPDDYWPMIAGKTASLLSCCCHLGAILGNSDEPRQDAYKSFGQYLGLAFQVQDDILGIWGDETKTGKSVESDIVEGKKSLPVLFGLAANGNFAKRWRRGPIHSSEVEEVAQALAKEGGYEAAYNASRQMTELAILNLREADPQGEAGDALFELVDKLLKRNQ